MARWLTVRRFCFCKRRGCDGEAGPEAILPLRRGADGKLGVVADIGGSGMAMFAPQYNIEINNDGTNGQIGPAALKVVYDLGKKRQRTLCNSRPVMVVG
ncbi:phage tail tape measure protein [Escherichia coli]